MYAIQCLQVAGTCVPSVMHIVSAGYCGGTDVVCDDSLDHGYITY